MVEISCPYCDFSKNIPADRIPANARWAVCPRCKERFAIHPPEVQREDYPGKYLKSEKPEGEKGEAEQPGPANETYGREDEAGFIRETARTTMRALFSPQKLFASLAVKKGYSEPLAFGLLFGSLGSMLGFFWQFLVVPNRFIQAGELLLGNFDLNKIFLGLIIAIPFFILIQLFLITLILHIGLIIFRGGKRGFEGTFRVIAYSQAARVWCLVPFVGGVVAFFWRLVIQITGLKEIHETTYPRVILAYFLPVALVFFFVLLSFVSLIRFLL